MPIQYLKDNNNNTIAVVIPISEWERITQVHQDIILMFRPKIKTSKKMKPSDYRGCISSETADEFIAHIQQSRTEWSSDIEQFQIP